MRIALFLLSSLFLGPPAAALDAYNGPSLSQPVPLAQRAVPLDVLAPADLGLSDLRFDAPVFDGEVFAFDGLVVVAEMSPRDEALPELVDEAQPDTVGPTLHGGDLLELKVVSEGSGHVAVAVRVEPDDDLKSLLVGLAGVHGARADAPRAPHLEHPVSRLG